jgi:Fe-S oxidoreductase/nitrate reductase gamma subunit
MTEDLSREIFGNLDDSSQKIFYALAFISCAIFAWGIWRRVKLWQRGRPDSQRIDWYAVFQNLLSRALAQRNLRGTRSKASFAHRMLFWGFLALFIGTILVGIEHYGASIIGKKATEPLFHKGVYFVIYEITLDTFGLLMIGGAVWFALRRMRGDSSMEHRTADWLVLSSIIVLGVTGYLIEGLRIIREATPMPGISFVGYGCSKVFSSAGVNQGNVSSIHFGLWWFHSIIAFGFIAALPFCRLAHAIAAVFSLASSPRPLGQMEPVTMEEVEETGEIGVARLEQFTRSDLLRLDACVSCGRCEDMCPAHEAEKPLSPRSLVQDLRGHMEASSPGPLHGETIDAQTLWACTTCNACNDICPLGVRPADYITDLRRHLIGEGELRGAPAASLQKMQRAGNPWGLPAQDRLTWAEGLNVPTVQDNPDFDVIYWVGCSAAYDRRTMKVARAVAQLLQRAQVNFAVLGPEERCSGESARRMGDEFLFQELAAANIETFTRHNVKKIVTHCPHCLNSLRQDYPQFDGHYEVVHHTQFLGELVAAGKLMAAAVMNGNVTYHDPCYLARVNGITDAPRNLLPDNLKEMPRHGCQTACCGAGGGRMWFDDPATERIGSGRITEAFNTGAKTVAVSCPFCLTMMTDGIAAKDETVEVRDVAELMADENALKNSDAI